MGQKVNPHGLRVGIIKDWDSRWFVKDSEFGATLVSDYKLRKYLKEALFQAGVPKIEIERDNQKAKVIIHCAKPGMVIGKGGSEIDKLKDNIEKIVGKQVSVNVVEVKSPDLNAQLVAESIAAQLERRISFRRAMKQAIGRTMKLGAKGIKIAVSGLLGGADIARTEHYHEGTIPLQTIRADIDYGYYAALTKMGLIGIKVWIYKGEVLTAVKRESRVDARAAQQGQQNQRRERPERSERPQQNRDRGERGDRPYQPRGDRNERGGRPQGQRDGRDNRDNRENREGGRNFNNRNQQGQQSQPPSNFGNRKTFNNQRNNNQRNNQQQRQINANADTVETPTEGGNTNDVNA